MDNLTNILSAWITRRDAMRTRHTQGMTEGLQMEFLRTLEEHANLLGNVFPTLNLAELEALCELTSSYLNTLRNRQAAFLRGQSGK